VQATTDRRRGEDQRISADSAFLSLNAPLDLMSDEKEEVSPAADAKSTDSGSTASTAGDRSDDTKPASPEAVKDVEKGQDNPAFDSSSETKEKSDSLELADMTPPPDKIMADSVDSAEKGNGKNPMEPSYVAVNEHKKGFRGEKLYVTKSTNGGGGCCKRLCTVAGVFILVGAIAVAVLVGVGVIDPHPNGGLQGHPRSLTGSSNNTNSVHDRHDSKHHDHDHHGHGHHDHDRDPIKIAGVLHPEAPTNEVMPEDKSEPEPEGEVTSTTTTSTTTPEPTSTKKPVAVPEGAGKKCWVRTLECSLEEMDSLSRCIHVYS